MALDVLLDYTQHDEMSQIVEELERDNKQLNAIFKEAATYGVEDSLREVWLIDKQRRELNSKWYIHVCMHSKSVWFVTQTTVSTVRNLVTIHIGKYIIVHASRGGQY